MGRYVFSAYFGHDASVAIVGEGRIVHLEAERFTRRKHEDALSGEFVRDHLFPTALKLIGASSEEVVAACEVGCGDHFASQRARAYWGRSLATWDHASAEQNQNNYLRQPLPCYFVPHHLAHAAYAFYTSCHEEARVGALDGGGDAWQSDEGDVTITAAVGKACHRFGDTNSTWELDVSEDAANIGGRWANCALNYCGDKHASGTVMAMVGVPESEFEQACRLPRGVWDQITQLQRDTTRVFHRLFPPQPGETDVVCLAGGCVLNGIAAYDLLLRSDVRSVHVPPAVHDGGLTVGAALFALHVILGTPRQRYSSEQIAFAGYGDAMLEEMVDVGAIAGRLSTGLTVAVVQGRAESGPRALGHRSILGDPRSLNFKDRLNLIKSRKEFRPVAPVVLRAYAEDYFELKNPDCYSYMTMIARAKPQAIDEIPAGIHLDGTARVQVVEEDSDLGRIIEAFRKRTGVPALLNTSFNLHGEAMVNDPTQARDTFGRSTIDTLVVGDTIVDRQGGVL